jgi:hypothetical protein
MHSAKSMMDVSCDTDESNCEVLHKYFVYCVGILTVEVME